MLSGTTSAPMRAAASHATTQSGPFGSSSATRVPLPTPLASSPRASLRERRSASPNESPTPSFTMKTRSGSRAALLRINPPTVHSLSGRLM